MKPHSAIPYPDAPALVDETGHTWRWRDLDLRPTHEGPACVLHQPPSGALVLTLWSLRGSGTVPILVHPREPVARRDALVGPVVEGLTRTRPAERKLLTDVVFTSGSTGAPRAIAHDDASWAASAASSNAALPFGPGDRWLLSLPLAHVSGLGVLERARLGGGCVVLPRPGEPLATAIVAHRITHLSVVRSQLADLLSTHAGRAALASLRAVIVGGGPTPEHLLADALAAGAPIHQTWGMTETCAMVTLSRAYAPANCGPPLPGRTLAILEDGLIAVGGPGLAAGFVDASGLTPLPREPNDLFHTRDVGALMPDGALVLLGRADSVFISGGEKIRPEEVESTLLSHPRIRDALVVPVPHPRWGMRPVAFIAFDSGPFDLRPWASDRLSIWAVPDAFLPFPPDLSGKPSRALLASYASTLLGAAP